MADDPTSKTRQGPASILPVLETVSGVPSPDGQSLILMFGTNAGGYSLSVRFKDIRGLMTCIQNQFAALMKVRTLLLNKTSPGAPPEAARMIIKPRPMRNLRYRLGENGNPILTIDVELGRRLNLALAKEDVPALVQWLSTVESNSTK